MIENTKWKEYIGKKVIVDIGWDHYIEVVVKEVSQSGYYIRFEIEEVSEWKSCYDYKFCEAL